MVMGFSAKIEMYFFGLILDHNEVSNLFFLVKFEVTPYGIIDKK